MRACCNIHVVGISGDKFTTVASNTLCLSLAWCVADEEGRGVDWTLVVYDTKPLGFKRALEVKKAGFWLRRMEDRRVLSWVITEGRLAGK